MTITIETGISIGPGIAMGQIPVIGGSGINRTVTANGNARVSTAQVKFGTGSYTSNSTAGFLRVTPVTGFAFGTGNFTMEFWYYPTSLVAAVTVMGFRPQGVDGAYPCILASFGSTGSIQWYVSGSTRLTTPANAITLNQWNAVAVVRAASNTRIYINGVQSGGTFADSTNYLAGSCIIGANDFQQTGSFPVTGFLDEIRVSNVARYTGSYTPATEPFLPDANTLLLLHCDGANNSTSFTDSSNSI
jgi:hypothetical protein